MSGVEDFIKNNVFDFQSKFNSCLQLVVYSYFLLAKSKKYSRQEILQTTAKVRGQRAKKLELEDFLRHELVTKYIEPNRHRFGLGLYQFHSGVEEFSSNVKTGILDVKVTSPLFNGNTYFIFECKKLNKGIVNQYIEEGILRFVGKQYYPESEITLAGMISFLESKLPSNEIKIADAFITLKEALQNHSQQICLSKPLANIKLNCPEHDFVDQYQYVFVSTHARTRGMSSIDVYHVVLDYNHLVID